MSDQSTLGGDTVSENKIEEKKKRAERKRKNPMCECGEPKVYVNEALESGFRGYLCENNDCPVDS